MSTVNTLRTGIHAALAALTTVDRYDALEGQDVFAVAKRKPAIVVINVGRQKASGPIGQRTRNKMRYRFALVFVAEKWRDGIGSGTELLDLSDIVDDIRNVQIGTVNDDPVYLEFDGDSWLLPPDRPADGGPAGYRTNWITTEVLA